MFIFASTSGMVTGWNPAVTPATTAKPGFASTDDAIYTGIALANNGAGNFLYLADFHNAKVDVLDGQYHLTHLAGDFTDPHLPDGFAHLTLPPSTANSTSPMPSKTPTRRRKSRARARLRQRLRSERQLPGAARHPRPAERPVGDGSGPNDFGDFSGDLLVGNFGDGKINAYDPETGGTSRVSLRSERQATRDRRSMGPGVWQRRRRRRQERALLRCGAG